jgi:orotidine-5'-phosphate decarboxylase
MTRSQLIENIKAKNSFLCIGLDADIEKIPKFLLSEADPLFEFNKQIIDATHDLCISYKPNLAFYESQGAKGFDSLKKTVDYFPKDLFSIADAKRGDIGNTASLYAKTFFDYFGFDAVTVNPYMGKDSVTPFLAHTNKWTILLALTSNKGAEDFQTNENDELTNTKHLFEQVLKKSRNWGSSENTMYVVGATKAEMLAEVRKIVPEHFLLVPGVGAQGGSLSEVCKYGMNIDCGLIVNASRSIIYASDQKDFAQKAREEAMKMQKEMETLLHKIK